MMTREEVIGHWNELRGRIEERWSQLGGSDLDGVDGNVDRLVGVLQQKTGQARGSIEDELESLLDDVAEGSANALQAAGEYAKDAAEYARDAGQQVAQTAREQYDRASDAVRQGVNQMQESVRRRPAESVAIAFGTGLVTGLVVGLMLRR